MIHMVFMKFEEGFCSEQVIKEIADAFARLRQALPDNIRDVEIKRNCIQRDANMDLLIRMELTNADSLPLYLSHPIHRDIGEKINPHIVNRCSFDYEA